MNGYTYNYPNSYGPGDAIGGIFAGCYGLFWLAFAVLMVVGLWKVFEKAGRPGWAAIIPIYNYIVLLEIVGRPVWWVLGLFIPVLNFVVLIVLMLDVARSFGKGTGFAIGLIFLPFVFIPMLGFGASQYFGPANASGYYPPAGGGYYPPQPGQPGYPPAPGGYQPSGYAPSGQPYQPPAPPAPPAPPVYAPPAPPVPPAYAPPAPPVTPTYEPPAAPVPETPAPPVPPAPPVEAGPSEAPTAPVEEAPAAPDAPTAPPSTPEA